MLNTENTEDSKGSPVVDNISNEIASIISETQKEINIEALIEDAPTPNDFEKTTLLNGVKQREYATNPDLVFKKAFGGSEKNIDNKPTENQETEKIKPMFNFDFKKSEPEIEPKLDTAGDGSQLPPIPPVQTMQFQEPVDPMFDQNLSASQNLTGQVGVLTSDLIWNNFENGLPEIMGSYVVKISESLAEDPIIDEQTQLTIKEDIAKKNKENKERFIIPEWYKAQIKEPLKAICVEKGIETSIPPTVQLLIGVGIMLGLFLIPTIMEVRKSNDMFIKRLDLHFEALREIERAKLKKASESNE